MHIPIEQDNASPHVLDDDNKVLAAANKDGLSICIDPQPAQSPDLNALDMGFLTASSQSSRVRGHLQWKISPKRSSAHSRALCD